MCIKFNFWNIEIEINDGLILILKKNCNLLLFIMNLKQEENKATNGNSI